MKRREFLYDTALTAALLTIPGLSCRRTGERPNIVIIYTDDQGYSDVGVYGARRFTTPNLDRLASEGMRFTNFYVSQAVCSASRASLLTGCYSERVSVLGALSGNSQTGLNPDEDTIADMLSKRGYTCGVFGKWHLGHYPEFLPLKQGFDEYFGLPYSNDMWRYGYDGKPLTSGWKSEYPPLFLIEEDKKVEEITSLEDQSRLTTRYTQRAVSFIERNYHKPFFLYLPHSMPHTPLAVSEKFSGKSEQGPYGDVIMEIDWSVGQILQALERCGVADNTLVIFTSDNGPWLNFGKWGGSARPLREGKGTAFEGGVREPCIMRWPGKIPAGTVCRKMAATIDILPTLAAISGAPLPKKKIDGVNILPLLLGEEGAVPRDSYFYYYGGGLRAVRKGDWKLIFPHTSRSYQGVKPGEGGLPGPYASVTTGLELYNLKDDIGETTNVAAEHPEIVNELEGMAEAMREQLGDRLQGRKGTEVRPPGRRGREKQKRISHKAVGKPVILTLPASSKYPPENPNPFTDGYRGSLDFADGYWQGFEGDNLEAVVDLGRREKISQVRCSFLQNQISWIFLPATVEFALSDDGNVFTPVKSFTSSSDPSRKSEIREFSCQLKETETRFVRVRAENIGTCPAWHPGSGGKSWIFADEIVVR